MRLQQARNWKRERERAAKTDILCHWNPHEFACSSSLLWYLEFYFCHTSDRFSWICHHHHPHHHHFPHHNKPRCRQAPVTSERRYRDEAKFSWVSCWALSNTRWSKRERERATARLITPLTSVSVNSVHSIGTCPSDRGIQEAFFGWLGACSSLDYASIDLCFITDCDIWEFYGCPPDCRSTSCYIFDVRLYRSISD